MEKLIASLESGGFIPWVWVFLACTALHEFEEWNINAFERRRFSGVPDYATARSARGVIAFICTAGLIWSAAASLPGGSSAAAWIFLPAVFFMLTNAFQHAYWSIRFREYAPGVVTALILIVPFGAYLVLRAVSAGAVPVPYPCLLAVVSAAVWIRTVRDGDRMSPFVRGAYAVGKWVSERLP